MVVAVGATERELPVTAPMPAIESEVALLTVQLKVDDWPEAMVLGVAPNAVMVGALPVVLPTVTATFAVVEP